MAWEQRGKTRYYYRSRRVEGRPVKEYIGSGPGAEIVAQHDALERADRQAERQAERVEQRTMEQTQQRLQDLVDTCDLLTRAALVAAGFHQHARGQWRRRHV